MASNYNQPDPENASLDNHSSDTTITNADVGGSRGDVSSRSGEKRAINHGFYLATSGYKILNDTHLMRSRRVNFNQRARKSLELMCEDKVSKYKLEEVHCSLPSSNKSTFIMTFSPDGQRVASTHGDHRIYICDLNTGKLLDTLDGHPKIPCCLAWHPSNREILASGCLAGEVRVWDLKSKACELWTSKKNSLITSLDFHPKERVLVIATMNDILFWDWSESEPFAKSTTTHDKEKVRFVEFDSSGTKLITGILNLPKFAGYSSDSLQNRIIDSYLTQGTLDQPLTENMTQNSEITGPLNGPINSNESFNVRNPSHLASNGQSVPGTNNNNEQDINYHSTFTLSRVASLYRQLEALEDSMRHTSFSPYINTRPINSPIDSSEGSSGSTVQTNQQTNKPDGNNSKDNNNATNQVILGETPPTQQSTSQNRTDQASNTSTDSSPNRSIRTPNAFEPFVVSFDEALVNLHLTPLVVDGQIINPASVVEQYPIEMPYQLHYMMQFDSINQVNQNFIRISKLMSSVRLYRQVVQQILSSNSGQGHYQPNQTLTAQSALPRSSRHTSSSPIVFRDFGRTIDSNAFSRTSRLTPDPILAIRFRNSARNVPLVTTCKIDLLCARSVCIMRSQQLIEQAISGPRPITANDQSSNIGTDDRSGEGNMARSSQSNNNLFGLNNANANPSFYPLLSQLHQSLTVINHTPLTTSNVHTHITSLRGIVNKLLTILSSMLQTQDEGERLVGLIHNIAHSLTGRSWHIPLGATLDDIRLDVIHTLCIVDLTLHYTRQVQLLQMQRLSAAARIEESRRASSSNTSSNSDVPTNNVNATGADIISATDSPMDVLDDIIGPSTSGRNLNSSPSLSKRKESGSLLGNESAKKRKVDHTKTTPDETSNIETEMIEARQTTSTDTNTSPTSTYNHGSQRNTTTNHYSSANQLPANPSGNLQNTLASSISSNPVVVWNSSHNQGVEQSLQRLLLATAASTNSHILVRIYHRLHGSSTMPGGGSSSIIDHSIERPIPPPQESRRRALSQDNSSSPSSGIQEGSTASSSSGGNSSGADSGRIRQVHDIYPLPSSSNGVGFETWPRHPHLHVYQTRGAGQHLWLNHLTIPLSMNLSNYRLQCWNFSISAIPNIKDSQSNIVTQKCRIHNDASIDISSDGSLIACLVPRDDGSCVPSFDLKIFSLRSFDFGVCYYQLPHGPNAISVSLSPSAGYAVVGLQCNKFISNDPNDDDLTIAKVFKLNGKHSFGYIRDIKIKRDDSALSLNAIRWMARGIVYNVGPQHHQRLQAARMRDRVA